MKRLSTSAVVLTLAAGLSASVVICSSAAASKAFAPPDDTSVAPGQTAAPSTPEEILKALDATPLPQMDRTKYSDSAYREEFSKQRQAVSAKRAELIRALYSIDSNNEKLKTLLPERWADMYLYMGKAGDVVAETNQFIEAHPGMPELADAYYYNVQANIYENGRKDPSKVREAALRFADKFHDDKRVPTLLYSVASYYMTDPATQKEVFARIVKDFPDSPNASRAKGKLHQYDAIGKPFKLEFTDALSDSSMSIAQLKGKVVVIDFWATWCGPCRAEMPENKKIYAEYKDKGVEFIGVSLDNARNDDPAKDGLAKLKDYVKANEIPWPQYYQGKGWDSEFSTSWGIDAIPCVFVVDYNGNLYSVDARGKLETILPKLIQERDGAGVGTGG